MSHLGTMSRGNTKTDSGRSRRYCCTLNNYTEEEYDKVRGIGTNDTLYIIGKEVGEKGTPHLQMYFEFKNAMRFDTLKKVCERMHIEKAKGNKESNVKYCSKEGNYITNFDIGVLDKLREEYKGTAWKAWQLEVIKAVAEKPDNRTITWYYDENGNTGKTYVTKYLCLTNDKIIVTGGKAADSLNQIRTFIESGKYPETIILDIPRSSEGFVSYGGIEQMKNGLFYSGKYEGGMCIYPCPHVIVFANFMPDTSKMSEDRWNIITL